MSNCDGWTKIEGAGADWTELNDGGDCKEWDSLSQVCWILDTGAWKDMCFWRDLSLWNDGAEPWAEVAA